jgi:phosphocarrier protein HPr
MVELPAIIRNSAGIHCRPSALLIKEVMNYPGIVHVRANSRESDMRSMMGLLALGLNQGTNVIIRVSGPDEEMFCRKLVALFQTHFDFPPRAQNEPRPVSWETRETSIVSPQSTT